jgi:hypothetical protein
MSRIRDLPGVVDVNVHIYEQILSSFFLGSEPDIDTDTLDRSRIAVTSEWCWRMDAGHWGDTAPSIIARTETAWTGLWQWGEFSALP